MRTNKYFLWALLLMPLFIACDNDENADGGDSPADEFVGEWSIKDCANKPRTEKKLSLQKDGKYIGREIYYWYEEDGTQRISEEFKTEGTYKYENGKLTTLSGETSYRGEYYNEKTDSYVLSDWELLDEEEDGKFKSSEIIIGVKLGGKLMTFTSADDPYTYFFFRDGASLPSDKSALKGTWTSSIEYKSKTYRYLLKIDDEKFDFVDEDWEDRFIGKYEYKDGYVKATTNAYYSFEGRDLDIDNLSDEDWELEDEEMTIPGFPIVVDGGTAYALIYEEFLVLKKK